MVAQTRLLLSGATAAALVLAAAASAPGSALAQAEQPGVDTEGALPGGSLAHERRGTIGDGVEAQPVEQGGADSVEALPATEGTADLPEDTLAHERAGAIGEDPDAAVQGGVDVETAEADPSMLLESLVIGADGDLVGYGGGLALKRWLLALEGGLPGLLFGR